MTEWKHYDRYDDPDIPSRNRDNPYLGYVYAFEYGDTVKIGSTQNPNVRIKTLESTARLYADKAVGSVMLSPPHTNFIHNEHLLHDYFKYSQIEDSERFNITLEEFENKLPKLVYENDTARLEAKSEAFMEWAKRTFRFRAPEQSLFDIIDSNPEQAADFYSILSSIANIVRIKNDIEDIIKQINAIIKKDTISAQEYDIAKQLNVASSALLEEQKELIDECTRSTKEYINKYFSDLDMDSLEVW